MSPLMKAFTAVMMFLVLAFACIKAASADETTLPQQQASNLAVPEVKPNKPTAAVMVLLCNRAVALGFIDAEGGYHDVPLEGLTKPIVDDLLSQVPASRVYAYVIPCGAHDGTPLG